jgi:hypothetical protein
MNTILFIFREVKTRLIVFQTKQHYAKKMIFVVQCVPQVGLDFVTLVKTPQCALLTKVQDLSEMRGQQVMV